MVAGVASSWPALSQETVNTSPPSDFRTPDASLATNVKSAPSPAPTPQSHQGGTPVSKAVTMC